MDIETMPHAMYFSGNKETITKINQVPYQVIDYDDKGMFQAKLIDNTQVEIFIDNGTTPSILPFNMYNKYPMLQKYPKMESHTPIHTGGGMIESHFWIKIRLRLENQIIQIKTLVCIRSHIISSTIGMARLCFQTAIYTANFNTFNGYKQHYSIARMHRNYITGAKLSKKSFIPHHMIFGKGIAYVKSFDLTLPLRPIDQYVHDRVTPATLSPKPIAYDKPIDPSEMPHILTCTEMTTEDTNVPTQDDKYPWLDPDDKGQQITDVEILRMSVHLMTNRKRNF